MIYDEPSTWMLGIPREELKQVAGERDVQASLLKLLSYDLTPDKR